MATGSGASIPGCCKGQESYIARSLDRSGEQPLVARTISGDATRSDLSSLADKLAHNLHVFVINLKLLVHTKPTHLAADHEPPSTRTALVFCRLAAVHSWSWSSVCHESNHTSSL